MKIKPSVLAKIGITILTILMVRYLLPSDVVTNTWIAWATLILSGVLVYKSRNNVFVTLLAFFILYSNYSIIVGEYLIGGRLGFPYNDLKTPEYYGITIKTLFVFMLIVSLFYRSNGKLENLELEGKKNPFIFGCLILLLIYILIFEVDRSVRVGYTVRISPLYEYSCIVFLFAFYFSKSSFLSRCMLVGLTLVFVLQDMIFGGRITSLQLMIFLAISIFADKVNFRRVLLAGFAGIFLNAVVGIYRASYILSRSLMDIFVDLVNSYLVFDTPVYAYFASVTHVAASEVATSEVRYASLLSFIKSIIFGAGNIMGNVTALVVRDYFWSVGGGLMPTHFFFWLGWAGVVICACMVVFALNRIGKSSSNLLRLITMTITIFSPRWYLYSPLPFFRGPLVFVPIMYLLLSTADSIIRWRD